MIDFFFFFFISVTKLEDENDLQYQKRIKVLGK